jgi:hypothetical protein
LDISPKLAAPVRARLPHWADRIFFGNAIEWEPPQTFDFVYSALEFEPRTRQSDLVAQMRQRVVAPGGLLVICSYRACGANDAEPIAERLRAWGVSVHGEAVATDDAGDVAARVAWSDDAKRDRRP